MALAKADISIELREISLKSRPESLYAISPKGTVPVLQINANDIIDESYDIMLWAIKNSKCNWLDNDTKDQLEMISSNDIDFKPWLDKYKYSIRYPENPTSYYRKHCANYLESYDIILMKQPYLFGNEIQLADIALFPFIRQCAFIDSCWFDDKFINLSKWMNQIIQSSLFIKVMKKYELWDQKGAGQIINFNKN